jgi:mono/diheme cytochrome c family protein
MVRVSSFLVASALAATAVLSVPARAQDAPPGDAANGQRVYLADGCFTCHGRFGQGGNYYGVTPVLAKTQLPFDGFKMQVRNPVRVMPPFSETVLSDKEAADIYAFLQTLPTGRAAKDIPVLNN